jgi:hypothetical protein
MNVSILKQATPPAILITDLACEFCISHGRQPVDHTQPTAGLRVLEYQNRCIQYSQSRVNKSDCPARNRCTSARSHQEKSPEEQAFWHCMLPGIAFETSVKLVENINETFCKRVSSVSQCML